MFTVCPKCALTLVVTAQDLRVAQGYVRCGRCSNVFNAIVGLTDDRGALAGSQPTASTSIMRKAPSLDDDPSRDSLSETGETEGIYAEPDADEVKFQEVFTDTAPPMPMPPPPPARTPLNGPISFVVPPPGPPAKAPPAPSAKKTPDPTKRYSDTEGIEQPRYSDSSGFEQRYSDTEGIEDSASDKELEFDPSVTDVTKVFVEAAPVTFRSNAATGKFEKIVLRNDEEFESEPEQPPAPPPPPPRSPAPRSPPPSQPRSGASLATSRAPAAVPGNSRSAASPPSPMIPAFAEPTSVSPVTFGSAPPAQPKPPAQPAASSPRPPPAPKPPPLRDDRDDRDDEDLEIDDELRSLAARIDVTASRPGPKMPPPAASFSAANDEAIEARTARFEADRDDDGGRSAGDIYAKAKPRPPPPRKSAPASARGGARGSAVSLPPGVNDDDEFKADGTVDSLAPARSRIATGRPLLWVAGAALLSIVLVVQAVHYNRHDLATKPSLNRPLMHIYKGLGIALVPNWDLNLYDVRQLGASSSDAGEGTLTVRASLKNSAPQPLPLPLLRITMQDRYGNSIATRDVPPTGYVPGAVPDGAQLGAGQRLDAEMTFKDPGQDAVGFEIDACLPDAAGKINCANDTAAVRP